MIKDIVIVVCATFAVGCAIYIGYMQYDADRYNEMFEETIKLESE